MTFQQLEYIVAVDKSRHFVNAAATLGVTQSTLSGTISKLEAEIDVIIFDRSKHPIEPTPMGRRIIQQAEVILHNSAQLRDMVQSEREEAQGQLLLGMVPSIAPVLAPTLGRYVSMQAPALELHLFDHSSESLVQSMQRSELDLIITADSSLRSTNLLSIDLWTEHFMVYASASHPLHSRESVRVEEMLDGNIWTLRSFHDHYSQLSEVTHQKTMRHTSLESGSLHTLVAAVDANGGFTLLPETFAACLTPEQRRGLHRVSSGKFLRNVSMGIRQDYMRERMLNVVTSALKRILPAELLSPRITKFDKVKL